VSIMSDLDQVVKERTLGIVFLLFNTIDMRYFFYLPHVSQFLEKARTLLLRRLGAKIGRNSYVRYGLFITNPRLLKMGENSKIGIRTELFLYAPLNIGNNVEIGSDLIVHTSDHNFSDPNLPLCKQGGIPQPVTIGSNVYIGSRVTILSGVGIDDYVIVAAGSVVTSDLESGFIYGGVPAKRIKAIHVRSF
jgi:maltose O-acetyltransferase